MSRRERVIGAGLLCAVVLAGLLALAPGALTGAMARAGADLWVSTVSLLAALLRPVFGG